MNKFARKKQILTALAKRLGYQSAPKTRKGLIRALMAGGALLGGSLALRAAKIRRLSKNPALRQLQEQAVGKSVEIATHRPVKALSRKIRQGIFGMKDISPARGARSVVKHPGKVVLHHGDPWKPLPVLGDVNLNTGGGLSRALADKGDFANVMKQIEERTGKKFIPETAELSEALRVFGGDTEKLRSHLNKVLPGGWLIKPKTDSLGKLENFIHHTTDPRSSKFREAIQSPHSFIIQEKKPIKREFRVHTVQGQPFTATYREIPNKHLVNLWNRTLKRLKISGGGGAHIPVMGKRRRELMKFVEEANKPLREAYKDAPIHQAFDVAQTPDGKFFLLESNLTPGTLMNPITSRKLRAQIEGRLPSYTRAGLTAGGLTAGASLGKRVGVRVGRKARSAVQAHNARLRRKQLRLAGLMAGGAVGGLGTAALIKRTRD